MRVVTLCLLLCLALTARPGHAQSTCAAPVAGADGWPVATPESVGLDGATLCALVPRFTAWREANIHSVLVARHGKLVFEHYFTGQDEHWGRDLGQVAFDATTLHDLRSVTKSVTALVLGIAIDHGWIKSVDEPVLPFFPEYAALRTPEKDRITLRHLLTMSAGLAWNEDLPVLDPNNSELRMENAPDPYRFVLEQRVDTPPGQRYNYSSGSTALIGAILRKATGKGLDELALTYLFEPLGIAGEQWVRYSNGNPIAGGGLSLRPRDMAKLGQLVLARGAWNGRQIVSGTWIDAATKPQINGLLIYFYGYQFWLGRSFVGGREVDWAAGWGLGGQRIFIVPSLDLVAVTTAGLYHSDLQAFVPIEILDRYVLAATEAARQ